MRRHKLAKRQRSLQSDAVVSDGLVLMLECPLQSLIVLPPAFRGRSICCVDHGYALRCHTSTCVRAASRQHVLYIVICGVHA